MKLTKKQQELLNLVKSYVSDMEQYKKNRGLLVTSTKEDQFGHPVEGVHFSPRIIKALFDLELVEYSWGNERYPTTEYRKDKQHILIPRGFAHPDFGWKVGDIGLQEFTCGSTTYEKCYGVCIKVEDGLVTFRPLNFNGSETFAKWACYATKHTIEEAMEHIKSQVTEIPNKTYMSC